MVKDYVGKFIEAYKGVVKEKNLENHLNEGEKIKEIANIALDWVKGRLNLSYKEYGIFIREIKRRLNYINNLSEFYLSKVAEAKINVKNEVGKYFEELDKVLNRQDFGTFHTEGSKRW